ncbi:hypothetical protein IMY05_C4679000600 [Salix suchowensis]|nr:hypothetical protein IMY05_C4679000600 [Salix suchowensis]
MATRLHCLAPLGTTPMESVLRLNLPDSFHELLTNRTKPARSNFEKSSFPNQQSFRSGYNNRDQALHDNLNKTLIRGYCCPRSVKWHRGYMLHRSFLSTIFPSNRPTTAPYPHVCGEQIRDPLVPNIIKTSSNAPPFPNIYARHLHHPCNTFTVEPSSPKTFLSTGGNSIEAAMVSAPITLNSQRARHAPLRPSPVSPLASDIPQPPSPTTARRRRLNKLQRHLGESIPPELVHSPSGRGRSLSITLGVSLDSSDSGEGLVFERSENLKAKDARTNKAYDEFGSLSRFWRKCTQTSNQRIDVTRLVESDATDDEDDTSLGSGRGSDEYQWVVSRASKVEVTGTEARRAAHRYSKRWVREQGGRRWEEHDYNDVLKLLRKL